MPDALQVLDIERGRHLPPTPGVDIDGHRVDDFRSEGGELLVTVEWHHRWPVDWVAGPFHRECIGLAHGPAETTVIHVLDDLLTVCNGPVLPKSVEAALFGYVAGLFAADEEVAA